MKSEPVPNLTDMVSPFVLKMITDCSDKYKKAYKSYAFGLGKRIAAKWLYVLMAGVIGVVMLMYFAGYIQV